MTMNPIPTTTTTIANAAAPEATLSSCTEAPLGARTGNDNATPKRVRGNPNALLAHPEVTRAIEGTLIHHGLPPRELRDGVAQVQMRALEAVEKKAAPADLAGWKALTCTIAERMLITDRRKQARRGRYDEGLCEEPDEKTPVERSPGKVRDPVDLGRQVKALQGQFEAGELPEHAEEILDGIAAGESYKEVGASLGLTEAQVRRRLMAMRKRFKAKLASLGMLTLMVLVAALFAALPGGVATRDDTPGSAPTGTVVRVLTPEQRALSLRTEALRACDAGRWDLCLGRLDEAAKLDPAGNGAADVRAARVRAEAAVDAQEVYAKPRP
jgi:DNA-directed RNA polymerase specialized sigma24 family protein